MLNISSCSSRLLKNVLEHQGALSQINALIDAPDIFHLFPTASALEGSDPQTPALA